MNETNRGSAFAVACLVLSFAAVHSFLASNMAKETAARMLGRRARNGFYRFGFIIQSVLTTGWAVQRFVRFPDRTLYEVPRPWSWMLCGIQIASLVLLGCAVHIVRVSRLLGLSQATAFLRGELPAPEPEAQGPPLAADGRMDARGPFRYIRHPDNLPIITLLWSFPRMTVNRITLAVLSSIYAILGSWHEDARLRRAYGQSFEAYARRTPMLVPRMRQDVSHESVPDR